MYLSKFTINKKSMLFVFLILQNNIVSPHWFSSNNSPEEMSETDIPGIGKSIPKKVADFIDHLKQQNLHRENNEEFGNALILHGPPGNGKTTLAKKMAEETNSIFIEIDAPSIVGEYLGSGPKHIVKLFTDALDKTVSEFGANQRVMIFIDEIDSLTSKNDGSEQYALTIKQLWLWIDRLEKNPRVSLIFATNNYNKLDQALKNRFEESAIVEIKNPSPKIRREIIEFYVTKIKYELDPEFELSQEYIDILIKNTDNFSIRSIKKLVYQIRRNKIPASTVSPVIKKYKENNTDPNTKDSNKWDTAINILNTGAAVVNACIHTAEFSLKAACIISAIREGKDPMEAIKDVTLPKIPLKERNHKPKSS
jgi:ATP-dependent 26S proteasome regulatory subunit